MELEDEDDADVTDVDDVELIDLTKPVRRDVTRRDSRLEHFPRHLSIAELRLAALHLNCRDVSSFLPRVSGLIVGENPGPKTRADMPLFPNPPTSSAGRLVAMSGLTPGQYLGGLYRRNLLDHPPWRHADAARRARCLITTLFEMPRSFRVVLCGRRVREAFGLHCDWWEPVKLDSRQLCVAIPHPSGMSHVYNDESARLKTRAVMRWAVLGEE